VARVLTWLIQKIHNDGPGAPANSTTLHSPAIGGTHSVFDGQEIFQKIFGSNLPVFAMKSRYAWPWTDRR